MPKVPPYSLELRSEAVRLLRSSGRSVPQLARELGCSPQSLRNWAEEREELRRLPRENRILAEERDILKKAAAEDPDGVLGLLRGDELEHRHRARRSVRTS